MAILLKWSITEFIDPVMWVLILFFFYFVWRSSVYSLTNSSDFLGSGSRSMLVSFASMCSYDVKIIAVRRLLRKCGNFKISFPICGTFVSNICAWWVLGRKLFVFFSGYFPFFLRYLFLRRFSVLVPVFRGLFSKAFHWVCRPIHDPKCFLPVPCEVLSK